MALKGADISATYQDWVHVNKSGAGLPDHAGAEAALYLDDGAGGVDQILGRTAVRHWLDPHPDAASFAETWEFSTKGTMTQGQLEAAGWTFTNCSGSVTNGILWLTTAASPAGFANASLAVSLSGDFNFIAASCFTDGFSNSQTIASGTITGGVGVGDSSGNVAHHVYSSVVTGKGRIKKYINGAYSTGAGTLTDADTQDAQTWCHIHRISGTIYLSGGPVWPHTQIQPTQTGQDTYQGWATQTTVSDSRTFDKIFLSPTSGTPWGNARHGFFLLRRFQ